ncbi:MAG: HNH endonuclease [Actinomycetota bacterium]|nr:HNH endonuclease [Actinomycetota bacterium]
MARRSIAGGGLPDDGGEKPRLVVTVPHTAVLPEPRPESRPATTCPAALGDPTAATKPAATSIARVDDLLRLAPSQLVQIACECENQTLVVDTLRTLPLWMSRRARLIRGSLRRALVARDGGCAFPSCDRPPQWCDAHHIVFWSEGGESSLANCVLVCGFHHRLLHKEQWQIVMATDGHPDFVPPPWIDPRRQARRQRRHQPLRT